MAKLDSNPGLSDSKVGVLSSHDVQQVNRGNADIPVHFQFTLSGKPHRKQRPGLDEPADAQCSILKLSEAHHRETSGEGLGTGDWRLTCLRLVMHEHLPGHGRKVD